MKKLAIILTTAIFFTVSAFALRTDEIPAKVKTAFEKNFISATNVTWEKSDNFYSASFNWDSFNIKVSFDENGNIISESRNLGFAQLPLKVSRAIIKAYNGYKPVGDAVEVISDDVTLYHITIENDKQTITLTSSVIGELDVDSKVKK